MFFGINNPNKNKNKLLHASASDKKIKSSSDLYYLKIYVRRTFLFSFRDASLTLETSIVLPIYIFFLTSMIYILNILDIENSMQAAMEETSRSISSYAYTSEKFDELKPLEQIALTGEDINFATRLINSIVNNALVKKTFLSDNVISLADNSYIENGHEGISVLLTQMDSSHHIFDFNINYKINIPFLSDKLFSLNIHQRCYFRTFTGEDITSKKGDYTQYVYITDSASVYHTSPYCNYLSKYYDIYPESYFENALSQANSFTPCSNCVRNSLPASNVFVCTGSQIYHNNFDCFYLDADIYKVTLDSVEDTLPLCSRCKRGIN